MTSPEHFGSSADLTKDDRDIELRTTEIVAAYAARANFQETLFDMTTPELVGRYKAHYRQYKQVADSPPASRSGAQQAWLDIRREVERRIREDVDSSQAPVVMHEVDALIGLLDEEE